MAKVFHLLKLAESFYKKALWSYFVTQSLTKTAADDLLTEAEKYDIKDEELFNQFESFMSAYKELLDSLRIDPSNLTQEGMEEAAQLIDTLNTRYERIINNSYLNMSAEGYDEDFDPGEFSSFIQKVVRDAETKLRTIAGEDVSISEMRAAQYANQFNQLQEGADGGKKEEWSVHKINKVLEARRNWFNKLMFVKKLGKSHPEYARYEKYIAMRRDNYQNIMDDPQRKALYRDKSRERQKTWYSKEDRRKEVVREKSKKIKERKESGDLNGLTTKYKYQLASLKKDTAVTVKNSLKKNPTMHLFNQAIDSAERQMASASSPANQAAVEDAKRKAAEFIANQLTTHPRIVKLNEDLIGLYAFRDACRKLEDDLQNGDITDIPVVIQTGMGLTQLHGKTYNALTETIKQIIDLLNKMRLS